MRGVFFRSRCSRRGGGWGAGPSFMRGVSAWDVMVVLFLWGWVGWFILFLVVGWSCRPRPATGEMAATEQSRLAATRAKSAPGERFTTAKPYGVMRLIAHGSAVVHFPECADRGAIPPAWATTEFLPRRRTTRAHRDRYLLIGAGPERKRVPLPVVAAEDGGIRLHRRGISFLLAVLVRTGGFVSAQWVAVGRPSMTCPPPSTGGTGFGFWLHQSTTPLLWRDTTPGYPSHRPRPGLPHA